MKIVQVMPEFDLAGAEIMCENLIYALQKKGIDIVVISMYSKKTAITDRLEAAGVDIRYLGKKSGIDFSMFKKMTKIFREEKADVIHTHLYTTVYAIPAACFAKVKRRVHTVHNVAKKENGRLGRFFNHIFFKFNHVIPVALSSLVQKSIEEEYSIKKENIPVIFNGIDLKKCQPKEDYEIHDNLFKILHIGRFMEQKNHQGLIDAFSVFHEKYPNSVLQLIGDGEKKQEVMEAVKAKGLLDSVQFLGKQENVHEYLHNADIFTLPSLYEGVPITLIEAMGTGLPIVATEVGGVPDMLINGENAILTSVDIEELVQAYTALYENQSLRETLGKNALIRSSAFSSEEMAKKYEQVYLF